MITPEMAKRALELRGVSTENAPAPTITPEMAQRALQLRGVMPQEDLGAQLHSKYPAQNTDPTMGMQQKLESGIESLPPILRGLYGANYQIANDPARAAKVAASSTLSSVGNISQGKPLIDIWPKEEKINYEKKANDLLGIKDRKRGDAVLGGLPLALIPELKAREGAGLVEYLATKGSEGTIYGQTANDPGAGAAIGVAGGAVPAAYTAFKNAGSSAKNKILDYISKESEKGRSFTPQETQQNIDRNFRDVQGNALNPDLGTATNNSALSNVYKVTSRVPFSGGKDQRSMLKKSLREVQERNFMQQHGAKQGELEGQLNEASQIAPTIQNENVALSQQANDAMERSRQLDAEVIPGLEKDYQSANAFLDNLAPEGSIEGGKRLIAELKGSFAKDKAIDKANYEAVDNFDTPLAAFSDPASFPHYRKSFQEFAPESESLKAIFGDDTDLGASLSKELNRGKAFIYGHPKGLGAADSMFLGKLSPEARQQAIKQLKTGEGVSDAGLSALLNHARSLQRVGAAAKSAGKRKEGSALFSMASSLKKDAKNILRENGHPEVAEQLENADKYYKSNILPYYEKPKIRKTVLYEGHSASPVDLSQELHGENQFSILQRLSPEAQKASLNQLLGKARGSTEGKTEFDTKEIMDAYKKLLGETKKKIEQYNPGTESYFAKLKKTKESIKSGKELSKHQLAVANTSFAKIKKNEDVMRRTESIKDKLAKNTAEKEKFLTGKYKPPFKGMAEPGGIAGKEAFTSLKKSGMTVLELSLLGLFPKTIGAAAVPAALLSRKANKLLTDPELLEKYLSGQKYSKLKLTPSKNSGAVIRALRIANQPNQEGTRDGRS